MKNRDPGDPNRIGFSARLLPTEAALLFTLRAFLERRQGRAVSQADVVRLALEALAEKETTNGFIRNV